MQWLNRLSRKFGRYSIPNLMYILSGSILIIYFIDLLFPGLGLTGLLSLNREMIVRGQIWRLVTFIFIPSTSSPIWLLFNLYFNCLIGNALEREWGSFKFNVFYLCGMIGAILGMLITGYGTNAYLNLSLFLAFAAIFPNYQILLFFFFPIKVKWLALLDILYFLVMLVLSTWSGRAAILMSVLNVLLFFGGDFLKNIKEQASYRKTRSNFRKYYH